MSTENGVALDALAAVLTADNNVLLEGWIAAQTGGGGAVSTQARTESEEFLAVLNAAVRSSSATADLSGPDWEPMKAFLRGLSRERALAGYSPTQTATFVFSLKEPIFGQLRAGAASTDDLAGVLWAATLLIDQLGLFTTEAYLQSREDVIRRQQEELLELSTPVVKLVDGVVAVPLIGTLDSARTQIVMETLLERIIETDSPLAIIDITGVPTVDTLVAQHLLKTVAAARLMGADCIISGIRPQIAQTIVQLGLDLSSVTTKASLADAMAVAFERSGYELRRTTAR